MAPARKPPASRSTPAAPPASASPEAEAAPLARYAAKRDFAITAEPGPLHLPGAGPALFVVQKHAARSLHYDFRLELDGVLLSWAVPKGPSLDPKDKRLAVHVEDHPVAYGSFEGMIPTGQYGAGTVLVWDTGSWEPVGDARAGMRDGKLRFRLHGQKLAGLWELVRIAKPGERQEAWLLMKLHDEWERPHADYDVLAALPGSVLAGRARPLEARRQHRAHADVPAGRPRQREGSPALRAAGLEGATRRALPAALAPQLATLASAAPTQGDWLYEVKFDGYRLLTRIARGKATLFTRGGHDWTARMPGLAGAVEALGLASGWLDGEAVVLDADGLPRFNRLQNALDAAQGARDIVLVLFDAPFVDGYDLRRTPLQARRALLGQLVAGRGGERVRFSAELPAGPAGGLHAACALGLEGLVAKRRDSPYTSTRSSDWLKLKCQARQEFVIAGFSDRSDNPRAVGALALGYFDERGVLRDAGRVGTGWSAREAVLLRTKLAALATTAAPFDRPAARPPRTTGAQAAAHHWVRPRLVAEISFAEWTPYGSLRHAVFQGLRTDKDARAVVRELAKPPPTRADSHGARAGAPPPQEPDPPMTPTPPRTSSTPGSIEVGGLRITHPDRVIDPASGHTKLDLARYYDAVAPWMLPHLKSRPAALVRAPEGVGGELFFQKHADVRTLPGVKELAGLWEGHEPLLEVPTAKALVAAAQMNVIEFHTWNSLRQRLHKPDRMVLDLDPGAGVEFALVCEGAQLLRALLDELGLRSWVKTSGGKGLHVVVPLSARLDYEVVKPFSQAIVQHLARTIPQRFVAVSGPSRRVGKIFVDYLRNGFNATTAAAFSARARPGLGVSMPVSWDELGGLNGSARWTITNALDWLSTRKIDPWADYANCRQTLTAAMKTLDDVGREP